MLSSRTEFRSFTIHSFEELLPIFFTFDVHTTFGWKFGEIIEVEIVYPRFSR